MQLMRLAESGQKTDNWRKNKGIIMKKITCTVCLVTWQEQENVSDLYICPSCWCIDRNKLVVKDVVINNDQESLFALVLSERLTEKFCHNNPNYETSFSFKGFRFIEQVVGGSERLVIKEGAVTETFSMGYFQKEKILEKSHERYLKTTKEEL